MVDSLAIGVDIGGSHITSALIDLNTQSILLPTISRRPVNAGAGAEEIIATWRQAIAACCGNRAMATTKLGIAMPGPFDYLQGISFIRDQNKYDGLYGLNVKSLLAEALGIPPENISFINDAASFLKGEVFGGAAVGCTNVLGLTLGTGFGSAILQNGEVEDANLWCDPYQGGIAEDLLSSRWFVKSFYERTGKSVDGVKAMIQDETSRDVALQIFREFGQNLGNYLVSITNRFDFDTVVIGGNISKSFSLFAGSLQEVFSRSNVSIKTTCSLLHENAALLGAASICTPANTVKEAMQHSKSAFTNA
ncbi:ROK family protein [Flavisolibacter sp. BT320]|nr:ROK family protein [Flavisolibacter longurius]